MTAGAPASRLLHDLFEETARRFPDEPAVDVPPGPGRPERRVVTYRQLLGLSGAIGAALPSSPETERVVAILLPRDSERLYAAQLAVLRSGAAYTCLDVSFPDGPVRDTLEDAAAAALLTDAAGAARARAAGWPVERVVDVTTLAPAAAATAAPAAVDPSRLAYLIYTSGTTGRPKGVMIEHRSIVNLVVSDRAEFGLGPGDRVAQGSSPAYDSSLEETWLAFASGATVVVMDDDAVRLGPDLVPWLRRERISVLCPPPTLLRTTGCADPAAALPGLRLLYVGGEALTADVVERWAKGRRLENGYGPTESTVTCLRAPVREGEQITIGRPVPGVSAWVLDEAGEVAPDGTRGELCLGGTGLARGYRNRPELTAIKFPAHPRLGRIYRTGDLAHREPDGRFVYHGRLDAQVKLRGYRIELEAVETRLAECPGVREAACAIQGEGARASLAAFVVAADPAAPPDTEALRRVLAAALPAYMVPSRIALLPELPKSVGGKLDRQRLPAPSGVPERERVEPRNDVEAALVAALARVLPGTGPVSVTDDFFTDLGGDSLSGAMLVSLLREDPATACLTVRDLYEARSAEKLAGRCRLRVVERPAPTPPAPRPRRASAPAAILSTLVEVAWLLVLLLAASAPVWYVAQGLLPRLVAGLGLVPFLLLAPVLALTGGGAYAAAMTLLVVSLKRLLIGRYVPARISVGSGLYVRHWMVVQAARLLPWRLLQGAHVQSAVLRALGARVGERVHLHRGVSLTQGGWDLLTLGDDATVGQDAALRTVDYEDGVLVIGPVTVGRGAALDVRAAMAADTVLGDGAWLGPLAHLPPGSRVPAAERWDGVPARSAGPAEPPPPLPAEARVLSPWTYDLALAAARVLVAGVVGLPAALLAWAAATLLGVDAARVVAWLADPRPETRLLLATALLALVATPPTLALMALVARLLGRVTPGVVPRWSLAYLRVWLKTGLVLSAGQWLSGTLYWPLWLRAAGMRIGPGCEISTILDVVPELVTIGPESFFADGIYLGGPRVSRGVVTLGTVELAANTFLGNHVVIPAGESLPADVLVGVCTVGQDQQVQPGTSWFGHPPFELPRREVVSVDRSLTHDPSPIRFWNRVVWETGRFLLPAGPAAAAVLWLQALDVLEPRFGAVTFGLLVLPVVTLGFAAPPCSWCSP